MSHDARKSVFGVSKKVRHKPGCTSTEDGLEAWNFGFRKKRDCTLYVAKTKALIICTVTAHLICGFVFAYAKYRFSYDTIQISLRMTKNTTSNEISRIMRKPDFCICENKGADQLRGNREADQRLCFRYTDSALPLSAKSEISSL